MTKNLRWSGAWLALMGLVGIAFFWLTDPRYGALGRWATAGDNPVDRANQAIVGTVVGIAGCAAMLAIGLWLMSRRRA